MNLVLENYVAVANMIADTFGDHCEVIFPFRRILWCIQEIM